ncbi:hypothetical protein PR048_010799 [Dryococelus australis]|uniref:Uncharacterized protein n=1 Tax=Dryococelus australis TaxID=614101 RepID=A0ABQ9I3Q2_9NEOP|nr:hypothetical protein PR048_010799 [Dryococelus australis]
MYHKSILKPQVLGNNTIKDIISEENWAIRERNKRTAYVCGLVNFNLPKTIRRRTENAQKQLNRSVTHSFYSKINGERKNGVEIALTGSDTCEGKNTNLHVASTFLTVQGNPNHEKVDRLLKGPLLLRKKDENGDPFSGLNAKWLRYIKKFDIIQFENSLRENEFKSLSFIRREQTNAVHRPERCYTTLSQIMKEKKQHILDLLSLIPEVFPQFYRNLKIAQGSRKFIVT